MYDDRSQPGFYSRKRASSREDRFNKRPRDDRRGSGGSGGFKRKFQEDDSRGDPYKLDYLVSLKQFQEYFLRNSRSKVEVGDEELLKRFNVYKENFTRKQHEKFFLKFKDSEWFREKYHPEECLARKQEIKDLRANLSQEFEISLKNGEFDSIIFEAKEPIKDSTNETDNAALIDKSIDLSHGSKKMLFITKIPDFVKRIELEEILRQKMDFERLILSDPKIEKNMTRSGWILLDSGVDLEEMCKLVDNTKVGNFTLYIVPNAAFVPKVAILPKEMSFPDRIKVDLEQVKKLARGLDLEVGIKEDSGVSIIDKWMESDHNEEGVQNSKKYLDLIIYYLMKVHQYDYYGGVETDSPESFVRKLTISLRPMTDDIDSGNENEFTKEIDSRVDLRINLQNLDDEKVTQLGGRSLTRVLDGFLASYVKKESETKYRCVECQKLFKGDEYVKKHLKTKHPELGKSITTDTLMFNAYILDPNKIDPVKNAAPRDKVDSGLRSREFSGPQKTTGRSDPRQIRSYEDLDAPADGDIELQYD